MKTMKVLLASLALLAVLLPVSSQAQQNVLNFTDREIPQGVLKQISQGKIGRHRELEVERQELGTRASRSSSSAARPTISAET